jgi:hypothetical protein
MPDPCRIYYINLCYEAYFSKIMEVAAESRSEACEFAMEHADDGPNWKDTLDSSSHWIEAVDHSMALVPEEFSAEAIRLGGAELVVRRLHGALRSLIQACDRDPKILSEIGSEVERAKAILNESQV